jgi:hypothetical protein
MRFSLTALTCPSLRGGRNEEEEIVSLGIAFGRLSLTRMRNDSRHGGRHSEPRESHKKISLWRIDANVLNCHNRNNCPLVSSSSETGWMHSGPCYFAELTIGETSCVSMIPFHEHFSGAPRSTHSRPPTASLQRILDIYLSEQENFAGSLKFRDRTRLNNRFISSAEGASVVSSKDQS